MATQLQHSTINQALATTCPEKPNLFLVHSAGNYDDLKRQVAGVASRGVHPKVLSMVTGCYATLLLSFWVMFAHDAATALVLAVVMLLMIVYFSLIFGGIVLADSPLSGDRQRNFSAFLQGPVDIATGIVSGREAAVQMLFLPACMIVLATTIGIIARLSQAS